MTYYKFAERNVDSQINWAEVGKNMTDMLANEVKIREEKKAALDQASRDYAQKLTDAPMGDNELLNNFTLDVADSAKQSLLMFDNLLKSGQLNPNDYLKSVQNLNTGTENLFNLSKEYNAQYEEAMKRMEAGESQQLEQDSFASLEGYAKLGNHKAYINPTDGTISLGEMIPGPNGVMQMGKPVSVSDLRNRITQKYNKYDVEKRVGEVIGSIQAQTKLIEIQNKYGISIVEEDDFFKKENGKYVYAEAGQFLENTIKGIKAIDTNVTSILTENVVLGVNGEQFMYVQKQGDDWVDIRTGEVVKEKKENHIETSINPRSGKREFNFTEKQEEQVDNYLKEQILARAKSEQRFKRAIEPPKPTPTELQQLKGEEAADKAVNLIGQLYYGTDKEIEAALDYFRDSIGADKVTRTNEGIIVTTIDKDENVIDTPINFKTSTGELKSQQEFIESAGPLLAGETDISGALKRGKYKKDAPFRGDIFADDEAVSFESSREIAKPEQPIDRARVYVRQKVNADDFTGKDDVDTIRKYEALYGPLGFTFSNPSRLENSITITAPDGTTITKNTNENSAEAAKTAEEVASWLASKITNENADIADQSNLFGNQAGGNKAPR
jgi:hypothetical protein